MNGDLLTDFPYDRFWEEHHRSQAIASIGTFRRIHPIDFGVLEIGAEGMLTGFREKPSIPYNVSMGIYAFRRDILDHVPPSGPFGYDDLILTLLRKSIGVNCYTHQGQWLDIGRPDDYERAQQLVVEQPAPKPDALSGVATGLGLETTGPGVPVA
jgi:NDP-sugar pyrophosphorylase family protein